MVSLRYEPTGDLYRTLLGVAQDHCDAALLVVRDESWLDDQGRQVIAGLRPFLREAREAAEWPGTVLLGGADAATLLTYDLSSPSVELLRKAVDGLYGWRAPMPEDLALLRNGEAWLASIAHERDSYLDVTAEEARKLVRREPGLRDLLDVRNL
jgi:hypothetical protein